jgi:hypothetical protein
MIIKRITWRILIVSIVISLSSCDSRYQTHDDEFYNDTGEFPSARIPLIKPCYLYSREGNPWTLWLSTEVKTSSSNDDVYYVYRHVTDVRKLSVQDGVIMAYSPYGEEQADDGMKDIHWFVVIPNKDIAMGFENENDFSEYIQQRSIQQPDWRKPDDIFNEYVETQCLDWIPDCLSK